MLDRVAPCGPGRFGVAEETELAGLGLGRVELAVVTGTRCCVVGLVSSRGASVTRVLGRCCVEVLGADIGRFGMVSSAVVVVRVYCNGWAVVVVVGSSAMNSSQSTSA